MILELNTKGLELVVLALTYFAVGLATALVIKLKNKNASIN